MKDRRHPNLPLRLCASVVKSCVLSSLVVLGVILATGCTPQAEVDLWYGDRQETGAPGNPQRWVNVLGSVPRPEEVESLTYRLNDGPPRELRMGPDRRRLRNPGDFIVEIDRDELLEERNRVTLEVTRRDGETRERKIRLDHQRNRVWPLPYVIEWGKVDELDRAAHVVDGRWQVTPNGVRTVPEHIDYDRVLAIGDVSWTDYEVEMPVTLHAVDRSVIGDPISVAPGLGIGLRWQGHTDRPVRCRQPHCGWQPIGCAFWYDFQKRRFHVQSFPSNGQDRSETMPFAPGDTYRLRMRVVSDGSDSHCLFRFWPSSQPEPPEWILRRKISPATIASGSMILIAHHIDVTFGDVTIRPVAQGR